MYSCSHFKSFLSQVRERIVIGAMSKRGSPTAKGRPVNLVMHSPCNEDSSTRFGISGQSVHDCRNDLMVHVSFLEPTNEKVHQQCSRRVCAKTRSGLSDRITNKKAQTRNSGLVDNQGFHTRFKASHAIFPFAECGPRFFHWRGTWSSRLVCQSRPTVCVSWPRGGHSAIGSRKQQVHS